MTRDELTAQYGDDLLFLDPAEAFDGAILGVASRCGMGYVVLYDRAEVINAMMLEGLDREEAEEFFEFNTAGAYVGPKTPLFLERLEDQREAA